MSGHKPKVLILTAAVGGGHIAAAKALGEAFQRLYADQAEVDVIEVFADDMLKLPLPIDKIAVSGYSGSVKLLNSYPYKLFFDFANVNHSFVNKFFTTIFRDRGKEYLKQKDPDILISTFPIISYAADRILRDWPKQVPIYSIVTDAGDVHKLWLMCPEDNLLVASPETIDYAVKVGVPRERLHYLGFPIGKEFSELPTKEAARKHLNLLDRPTVYLTGGGLGLSTKLLRVAKRLAKVESGAQYIFVAGRNERLKKQLEAIEFKDPVRVYGYVDNVPMVLAAADLVVGKAGWLTLYENMIARRPTIIIDVIPGQEEPNAEFVEHHGVGLVLRDPDDAAAAVIEFVGEPERLKKFEQGFNELNLDPRAGEKIARFILENYRANQP